MTMPAPSVPPAAAIPVCESGADIAVVAGSQRPAQPPTSTAPTCSVSQPTPDSACSTVAPTGNSTTDGCATAPRTVSTSDPGSSGWPTCRNHSEPLRDSSARLAKVSTFCTSVGRPFTPRSAVCGGLYVGSATFPDSSAAVADDSPVTYRSGAATSFIGASSVLARRRSPIARSMTSYTPGRSTMETRICRASTASAATCAPSRMRCGIRLIRKCPSPPAGLRRRR